MLHVGILIIKKEYTFKTYGKNKIKVILRQFYRVILFLLETRLKIIIIDKYLTVFVKNLKKFYILISFFKKLK